MCLRDEEIILSDPKHACIRNTHIYLTESEIATANNFDERWTKGVELVSTKKMASTWKKIISMNSIKFNEFMKFFQQKIDRTFYIKRCALCAPNGSKKTDWTWLYKFGNKTQNVPHSILSITQWFPRMRGKKAQKNHRTKSVSFHIK